MGSMTGLNFAGIALLVFLIVTQIVAVALLPKTAGFTNIAWTGIFLAIMFASQWSFAVVLHRGMPLGLLSPMMAAVIPLVLIAIGVIFYREAASVLRIGLLVGACGLIGVASTVR